MWQFLRAAWVWLGGVVAEMVTRDELGAWREGCMTKQVSWAQGKKCGTGKYAAAGGLLLNSCMSGSFAPSRERRCKRGASCGCCLRRRSPRGGCACGILGRLASALAAVGCCALWDGLLCGTPAGIDVKLVACGAGQGAGETGQASLQGRASTRRANLGCFASIPGGMAAWLHCGAGKVQASRCAAAPPGPGTPGNGDHSRTHGAVPCQDMQGGGAVPARGGVGRHARHAKQRLQPPHAQWPPHAARPYPRCPCRCLTCTGSRTGTHGSSLARCKTRPTAWRALAAGRLRPAAANAEPRPRSSAREEGAAAGAAAGREMVERGAAVAAVGWAEAAAAAVGAAEAGAAEAGAAVASVVAAVGAEAAVEAACVAEVAASAAPGAVGARPAGGGQASQLPASAGSHGRWPAAAASLCRRGRCSVLRSPVPWAKRPCQRRSALSRLAACPAARRHSTDCRAERLAASLRTGSATDAGAGAHCGQAKTLSLHGLTMSRQSR